MFIADQLAKEVDFFSIGTNDLIQYAMAVDRSNDDVAYLYRPCAPAVLRMLHRVCEAARTAEVDVTVCGEMAADPFHVPLLVGLGVRTLSMSANAIPLVKRLVRRVRAQDCAALVEEAMDLPTADDVEAAVAAALQTWDSSRPAKVAAPAPCEEDAGRALTNN